MQDEAVMDGGGARLSQVERVVDTFVAPSKTFTDILRSASCWLPIVLLVVISLGFSFSVGKTVGFPSVVEQSIAKNPKMQERMESVPADQRAASMAMQVKITKGISYVFWIFILVMWAVQALVLWASFNFGLGAETKFGQVFAVVAFAGLPGALKFVLSAVLLFAGVGTENFDMQNPIGTNLGYYLTDSAKWMQTAGTFLDLFTIWSIALMVIGMAIISRKKISQSATVVVGWWLLLMLISVGAAAAFS